MTSLTKVSQIGACDGRQLPNWSHDKPDDIYHPREASRKSSSSSVGPAPGHTGTPPPYGSDTVTSAGRPIISGTLALACSNCPAAFSSAGRPDLLVRFYYAPVVCFAAALDTPVFTLGMFSRGLTLESGPKPCHSV